MAELTSHSLQKFSTLVRLNPEDVESRLGLAMAMEEAEQFPEAFKEYEQILRIDKHNSYAHLHMGFTFARGGETAPALKKFEEAYSINPDLSSVFEDQEKRLYYQKRIREAIVAFERPVLLRPEDAWSHYQLAMANKYFNRKEIALSHLKKAIDLNPNLWESLYAAGEIYAELDLKQFAKTYYQKAIDADPKNPETYYKLGVIFEGEGMVGIAIQKYERALEADPQNAKFLFALGQAYLKQGEAKKAIGRLQKSIDLDPTNPKSHLLLAKACEAIYRPDFAVKEYNKAVELEPKYAEAHYDLGILHLGLGEHEKAIASLEQALKINSTDPYIHYNLGNAYEKVGNYQKAINHYFNTLSLNPKDTFARYNLGQVYFRAGHFTEAIREFKKCIELNPNDVSVFMSLGAAYGETGDYNEAIETYKKALDIKPNDYELHYALARTFMADGKFDIALHQFKKVSELKPGEAEHHYEMGQCYYRMGEVDYAFEQFQKAIKFDEKHVKSKYAIGLVYSYNRNMPDIAMDFFDQSLEIDGEFLPAIIEKGYAYLKMKKLDEAAQEFEKAAIMSPDEPEMLIGRGEVYTERGKFDLAEEQFQRVLTVDPENPRARSRYAWSLALAGEIDDAIEQLLRALSLEPGNIGDYYQLADLYLKKGNIEETKATLSRLLDYAPDEEKAGRALDVLFDESAGDVRGYTINDLAGYEEEEAVSAGPVEPAEMMIPESIEIIEHKKEDDVLKPVDKTVAKKSLKKRGLRTVLKSVPGEGASAAPIIEPAVLSMFTKAVAAQASGKDTEALQLFQEVLDNAPDYYQVYSYLCELTHKMGYRIRTKKALETGLEVARKYGDRDYMGLYKKRLDTLFRTGGAVLKDESEESVPVTSFQEAPPAESEAVPKESEPTIKVMTVRTSRPPIAQRKTLSGGEFIYTKEILPPILGKPEDAHPQVVEYPRKAKEDVFEEIPSHKVVEPPVRHRVEEPEAAEIPAKTSVEREYVDEALDFNDEQIRDHLEIVQDFLDLKKYDKAKSHLKKLIKHCPDLPEAYKYMSTVNGEEGDWENFLKNWQRFIELTENPDKKDMLILNEARVKTGKVGEAISSLKEMAKEYPEDEDVLEKLVAFMLEESMYEDVIPYLKTLSKNKPEDPRFLFNLARAYRHIGKFSLSTVQYQKVLRLTQAPEIYNELGYTYEKIGKTQSAISTYEKSLEVDPTNITANLALILLFESNGEVEKAIRTAQTALGNENLPEERRNMLKAKLEDMQSNLERGIRPSPSQPKVQEESLEEEISEEESEGVTEEEKVAPDVVSAEEEPEIFTSVGEDVFEEVKEPWGSGVLEALDEEEIPRAKETAMLDIGLIGLEEEPPEEEGVSESMVMDIPQARPTNILDETLVGPEEEKIEIEAELEIEPSFEPVSTEEEVVLEALEEEEEPLPEEIITQVEIESESEPPVEEAAEEIGASGEMEEVTEAPQEDGESEGEAEVKETVSDAEERESKSKRASKKKSSSKKRKKHKK